MKITIGKVSATLKVTLPHAKDKPLDATVVTHKQGGAVKKGQTQLKQIGEIEIRTSAGTKPDVAARLKAIGLRAAELAHAKLSKYPDAVIDEIVVTSDIDPRNDLENEASALSERILAQVTSKFTRR